MLKLNRNEDMTKTERAKIKDMYSGRCAYCAGELKGNSWHVDHVKPIYRGWRVKPESAGEDTVGNMMPACKRCNLRKSTLSVEQFRSEIEKQTERLKKFSSQYRLALDYGTVEETFKPVVFYFEIRNASLASVEPAG